MKTSGLAGFALDSNMTAICSNTSVYVGVTIFPLLRSCRCVDRPESTRFFVSHGSRTSDRGRQQHFSLLNTTVYVGVTIFALCWSALSLPGSCQPLSRNLCSQSRAASASNVWFIMSSLYSYIERLRPLNTQSLTLSRLLCTFTNQVLAELDLLWYWSEGTLCRLRATSHHSHCCCVPSRTRCWRSLIYCGIEGNHGLQK